MWLVTYCTHNLRWYFAASVRDTGAADAVAIIIRKRYSCAINSSSNFYSQFAIINVGTFRHVRKYSISIYNKKMCTVTLKHIRVTYLWITPEDVRVFRAKCRRYLSSVIYTFTLALFSTFSIFSRWFISIRNLLLAKFCATIEGMKVQRQYSFKKVECA